MNEIEFKKLRKQANFSQKQLAEVLEISTRAIQYYEKGERSIPKIIQKYMLGIENNILNDDREDYKITLPCNSIKDCTEKIYYLQSALKDKEEIITLLKDKLKQYE